MQINAVSPGELHHELGGGNCQEETAQEKYTDQLEASVSEGFEPSNNVLPFDSGANITDLLVNEEQKENSENILLVGKNASHRQSENPTHNHDNLFIKTNTEIQTDFPESDTHSRPNLRFMLEVAPQKQSDISDMNYKQRCNQESECGEDTEYDAAIPTENSSKLEKCEGPSLPAQCIHNSEQQVSET